MMEGRAEQGFPAWQRPDGSKQTDRQTDRQTEREREKERKRGEKDPIWSIRRCEMGAGGPVGGGGGGGTEIGISKD